MIAPVGEFDLASAGRLEAEVMRARSTGASRIVLDLSQVGFIGSTGLRVLLSLRSDSKRNGHALLLVPRGRPCGASSRSPAPAGCDWH